MYFLDLNILAKQLLPPNWRINRTQISTAIIKRDSGYFNYLQAILKPFEAILNDFKAFGKEIKTNVNLSAQTIVVENHIEELTGIRIGISVSDGSESSSFSINIPIAGQSHQREIIQFLQKIVPMGRKCELIFY